MARATVTMDNRTIFALGLALAIIAAPHSAQAVGPEDLPPKSETLVERAPDKSAEPDWRLIYAGAVKLIKSGDPEAGLAQLLALRLHEREARDHPDVLNFIAFAHRKMKRYPEAKVFYEAALKRDPDHLGALEYYGEWHIETGDVASARRFLERLRALCGGVCEEYRDLQAALEHHPI